MAEEMFGNNGEREHDEVSAAECQPVSQETLTSLLEVVRARCPAPFIEMTGSGGVLIKGVVQNGKQFGINLHYYSDNRGPTRFDTDGSMAADTTGRYKRSADGTYYDMDVQATIFKTEKIEEAQADSKKIFTSYEITRSGQQLDVKKRVRPFGLPVLLKVGDKLIPERDGPPLITAQERQASARQEDELGLSTVSEGEASGLIELLRPT